MRVSTCFRFAHNRSGRLINARPQLLHKEKREKERQARSLREEKYRRELSAMASLHFLITSTAAFADFSSVWLLRFANSVVFATPTFPRQCRVLQLRHHLPFSYQDPPHRLRCLHLHTSTLLIAWSRWRILFRFYGDVFTSLPACNAVYSESMGRVRFCRWLL